MSTTWNKECVLRTKSIITTCLGALLVTACGQAQNESDGGPREVGGSANVTTDNAMSPVKSSMPDTIATPSITQAPVQLVTSQMATMPQLADQMITPPIQGRAEVSAPQSQESDAPETPVDEPTPAERVGIGPGQICAAAIGIIMGRNPATMRIVEASTGSARVQYVRLDRTRWTYDCMVGTDRLTWRTVDRDGVGSWRGDDITYTADDRGMAVTVNGETRAFLPPT